MKLGCLLTVTAFLSMAPTNAAVIADAITASGASASSMDPFFVGSWEISTTAGDATLFGDFSKGVGSLVATTFTIGRAHTWFPVDEGIAFTPSFAAMATPFAPFETTPGSDTLTPTFEEPFFLGVELGDDLDPEGRQIGWVELVYSGVELRAVSSAIDESGRGLIVGTQTVVPEPSTLSFLLPCLGLFLRRKR